MTTATAPAPITLPRLPRGDSIGLNTGIGPNYYGRSYALADVVKTSTVWTQSPWVGDAVECSADRRGGLVINPALEPPQAWIRCYDGSTDFPLGTYTCLWEGDGDFQLEIGPPDWVGFKWGGSSGRADVPVTVRRSDGQGLKIICTRSNPKNPVIIKKFRFLQPGCEGSKSSLRPEFLRSYRGVAIVRPIKDNGAEASRIVDWKDRAMLSDPTWTGPDGLPYEVQIELANAVKADLYLNIPYWASDDFVRMLARLVKRTLAKSLRVFAEYSNEIWNWGYPGSQDASNRYAPGTDATNGNFFGQTTWGPYRARQVHAIFASEFTGSDRSRLVTVLGGMFGWSDVSAQLVNWARGMAGGGPPADALAVAPYFDLSDGFKKGLPELAGQAQADQLDALFADLVAVIGGNYRDSCRGIL